MLFGGDRQEDSEAKAAGLKTGATNSNAEANSKEPARCRRYKGICRQRLAIAAEREATRC